MSGVCAGIAVGEGSSDENADVGYELVARGRGDSHGALRAGDEQRVVGLVGNGEEWEEMQVVRECLRRAELVIALCDGHRRREVGRLTERDRDDYAVRSRLYVAMTEPSVHVLSNAQ